MMTSCKQAVLLWRSYWPFGWKGSLYQHVVTRMCWVICAQDLSSSRDSDEQVQSRVDFDSLEELRNVTKRRIHLFLLGL